MTFVPRNKHGHYTNCICNICSNDPDNGRSFGKQETSSGLIPGNRSYYAAEVEPIHLIEAQNLDFLLGSVCKYICRSDKKGSEIEDLEKAKWYLERKIESLKRNQDGSK